MTLLVALRGSDGIVVATDSRGTFGDPRGITAQNDSQKKLYIVSKYASILTAGSGELGASIMQEFLNSLQPTNEESVTTILNKVRTLIRTRYSEWFAKFEVQAIPGSTKPVRPSLSLIIAGYDNDAEGKPTEQKIFQLLSQTDFAPMLHNYGFALSGVAQYALYLLNRLYENDLKIEILTALAAYVITETASQDGKVGGQVQMAIITPIDGCKELSNDEIDKILDKNKERSKSLKDSFFKEK